MSKNTNNTEYQFETINGFKIDKTNNTVILTNKQRQDALVMVDVMAESDIEISLDDMVIKTLSKQLGDRFQGKFTYGKSRSSSANTKKMTALRNAIELMVKDKSDIMFDGRPAFIDSNGIPKYVDVTFVLKTPKGQDPTEFKNECKEQVKNLLGKVKSETKTIINQ